MENNTDDKEKQNLIKLYIEQMQYLRQEYVAIQNSFLAGSSLPLTALGILTYYIEDSGTASVKSMYLFLPFLFLFVPYNLIKYSIRMMGINAYMKHLETSINTLVGKKIFIWNNELINCSCLKKGGFAVITTAAQIPIYVAIAIFILVKFINTLSNDIIFKQYHTILIILLFAEFVFISFMLIDFIFVQKNMKKKISASNQV